MLLRILILMTLVLGTITALTAAWTNPSSSFTQNAEAAFVPQAFALDPNIVGSGIDAGQLLEKALEKLRPAQAGWMKTKIRQSMIDANSNFIAQGFLQRGPNHCARLELEIVARGQRGRFLVVSDGELVAQAHEFPGKDPQVVVEHLPEEGGMSAKETILAAKGCGGPIILLQQVRQHLHDGKLQTGLLGGAPAIRVKGEIDPDAMSISAAIAARQCSVYLDADTLWPLCFEWTGTDKNGSRRSTLRVEFIEPVLDQELPVAECMRVFSYRPGGE